MQSSFRELLDIYMIDSVEHTSPRKLIHPMSLEDHHQLFRMFDLSLNTLYLLGPMCFIPLKCEKAGCKSKELKIHLFALTIVLIRG